MTINEQLEAFPWTDEADEGYAVEPYDPEDEAPEGDRHDCSGDPGE